MHELRVFHSPRHTSCHLRGTSQGIRSAREAAFYQVVWPPHLRCVTPPALHNHHQQQQQQQQQQQEQRAEEVASPDAGQQAQTLPGLWGCGEVYGTQQGTPSPQDVEGLRAFIPQYCEWQERAKAVHRPSLMDHLSQVLFSSTFGRDILTIRVFLPFLSRWLPCLLAQASTLNMLAVHYIVFIQ